LTNKDITDILTNTAGLTYSRKPSHDEESLDDIFKSSAAKHVFPAADDDDDLFKSSSSSSQLLTDMSADDISSYIQKNTQQEDENLDLF
jgi:hypothetical protein